MQKHLADVRFQTNQKNLYCQVKWEKWMWCLNQKEGQIGQDVAKKITVTANTEPGESYLEIKAKVIKAL